MTNQRIAILGAGPIGVEAAIYALEHGYGVDLYERETPGAHVADWAHVRLFSPWEMNRSPWGARILREAGHELGDAKAYPTAREYLDRYLLPLVELKLSALEESGGRLHEGSRVVGVSRRKALKGDYIGDERRGDGPFVILCDEAGCEETNGERYAEADIVIDTTGVYTQPGHLGPGGLPALGERDAEAFIERQIPDVLGADRLVYEDKTTLLVGNGFSAVTSANLLAQLHEQAPGTRVHWLLLDDEPPYTPIDDDPLPERLALTQFGNAAARGQIDGIEPVFGQLARLVHGGLGRGGFGRDKQDLVAEIDLIEGTRTLEIDRVIGNVGYKPDTSLYRELQVHQCYASEGPMKLSAYLLGQKGGAGDCLAQTSGGFETLVSPEPDFYILGSKSYGRNSDFLLQRGFEQIEELFGGLTG
jgi:thioredoxin reductase